MKKIYKFIYLFIAVIAISFSIENEKTSAYTGGLLNGKTLTYYNSSLVAQDTTTLLTDNNESTSAYVRYNTSTSKYLGYRFAQPQVISYVRYKGQPGVELYYREFGSNTEKIFKPDGAYQYLNPTDGSNIMGTALNNIEWIYLRSVDGNNKTVFEFDVFPFVDNTAPMNVTNLSISNITHDSFTATWTKPSDIDLYGYKCYIGNKLVATINSANTTNYTFTGQQPFTQYELKITAFDNGGNESSGVSTIVKTNEAPDTIPPLNVTNLKATATFNSVFLSWTNPPDTDFAKVKIYEDGVYKKSVTVSEDSNSSFENLDDDKEYTYKVTSVDFTGNESTGSTIVVKTLKRPPLKNIKNLNKIVNYKKVVLTWDNPTDEDPYFQFVRIYRKDVQQSSFFRSLFSLGFSRVYAAEDEYDPIFETNGTYWSDLTVKPESDYGYKLTSVNLYNQESTGVTTEVTTPEEPIPVIEGAKFEQVNGNLVVSWDSPTTGTIKIFVGGDLYKTVQANLKTYTIPKDNLKYNNFGDPDVKIQPIGVYGAEGKYVQNTVKLRIPFSAADLFTSSNNLIWLIAPFVLLALSFILVPKLRKLISKSVNNGGS